MLDARKMRPWCLWYNTPRRDDSLPRKHPSSTSIYTPVRVLIFSTLGSPDDCAVIDTQKSFLFFLTAPSYEYPMTD